MYKLGQRPHDKQKLYAALILLFAGLIMFGAWAANKYFQSETTISNGDGVVRHLDIAKPKTRQVTTSIFTLEVPQNWRTVDSILIPAAQYAWHGTGPEESSRSVEMYVDDIPAAMPVNKLLPVRGTGERIEVRGEVSGNCINFTDSSKADKRTGKALTKWSNVSFYCDTGNYARNVVGTGSQGAINSVTVSGPLAGKHRFFFIYTDHSAEPDYAVFIDMLNSFYAR